MGFQLKTASLKKYKNMLNAWGGWDLFQKLLNTLQDIATKYQVSISNVAVRYILEQPVVAGAIVGARLSISEQIQDNAKIFSFSLSPEDDPQIDAVSNQAEDLDQRRWGLWRRI
jgi:aryl-alcohol dehydrogenase-like predicted oxidoreductase